MSRGLLAVAPVAMALIYMSAAMIPATDSDIEPPAASSQVTLVEDLNQVMPGWQETWSVPGVAVGVVIGNAVILQRGYGFADVAARRPVDEETVFSVGSVSKTFTGTLIAALVDRGQLSWDQPVLEYEPAFDVYDARAESEATLRDLMAHRSGIPFADSLYDGRSLDQEALLRLLSTVPPAYPFREGSAYSNLGVLWAGRIAAKQAAGTWETVLRREVLDPLGLESTFTVSSEGQRDPRASLPYGVTGETLAHHEFLQSIAPAGAIYSNLVDMTSFARSWLQDGASTEFTLSRDQRQMMMRPVVEWDAPSSLDFYRPTGMGLGWFTETYRDHKVAFHSGVTRGFSAQLTLVPDRQIGIVVLSNRFGNPIPFIATHYLLDRLLGAEPFDFSTMLWDRQQNQR